MINDIIYYIAKSNKTNEPIGGTYSSSQEAIEKFEESLNFKFVDTYGYCVIGMKEIEFDVIQHGIKEKKEKKDEFLKKRKEEYDKKHKTGAYKC